MMPPQQQQQQQQLGMMPGAAPGSQAPTSVPGGSVAMAEVDEQMQCLPAYMQLSMGAFPREAPMVQKSALPFGCCVHPLAEGEGSLGGRIPVVNFGASGVVRCKRCRWVHGWMDGVP